MKIKMRNRINDRMMFKIRMRFVLAAMSALIVMQAVIIFFSVYNSYSRMVAKSDSVIAAAYEGIKSGADNIDADGRFFWVSTDKTGRVTDINTTYNRSVKPKAAARYYRDVIDSGKENGFYENYRYAIYESDGITTGVFLLRSANIDMLRKNAVSMVLISAAGLGIMLIILIFASGIIVKPMERGYQKQKEFITSASHELKTPLTVIMADTDILQMDDEDNEWVHDIRVQADRLTGMTNSLVSLARLDERGENINRIEFPISDVAQDIAGSYKAMAISCNKEFVCDITPGLSFNGDENGIRQLFTILLDNAFKYCSDNGRIELELKKNGSAVKICVRNNVPSAADINTDRMFDRFYRADATAAAVKGYGLGLSIAASIAAAHRGSMRAYAVGDNVIAVEAVVK